MNFMGTSRMLSGIRSAASEMFLRPGSRPLSMQRGVCFADAAAPAAVIPRPPFLKDMAEALKTAPTDPVLGRDDVIQEIVSALGKEEASSVILTGISGVGKTVLMYEVARLIMRGDLPRFEGYQLFIIEAEKFAAGGMPEGQVVALKNFIANYPGKVLLFVDEIQRLFSMSGATGPVMDSIKEDMARNLCTLFGTATVKDFDKSTRFDSALFRRLNVIELPPLSADITQDILCSKAPLLEQTYNTRGKRLFRIPEEVLELLVRLAGHYIKDRAFPDKALKTLESAVSSRDTALETSKARLKNVVQTLQLEINRTLRAIRDQSDENIVQAKNRLVELCAEYLLAGSKNYIAGRRKRSGAFRGRRLCRSGNPRQSSRLQDESGRNGKITQPRETA